MEEYNGGVIFYSLGNFCFGGNLQPTDLDSVLVQQEYIRDAEGNIRRGELTVVPMCISSAPPINNFQPTPYEEGSEEYQRVMDKLGGLWDGITLPVDY
jgi:poly-gamma-glutamate synthesis protein (capsule biosynthesis protein)